MTDAAAMIAPSRRNLIKDFLLDCAHVLDDDRRLALPARIFGCAVLLAFLRRAVLLFAAFRAAFLH